MIELYVISSDLWPIGKPELKGLDLSFSGKKLRVLYLHPNDIDFFNFDLIDNYLLISEEEYALLLLQIS